MKNNVIKNIDDLSIAAIRSLSIDLINKANSGHPGMSLSSAPILYCLYKDFMKAQTEFVECDKNECLKLFEDYKKLDKKTILEEQVNHYNKKKLLLPRGFL